MFCRAFCKLGTYCLTQLNEILCGCPLSLSDLRFHVTLVYLFYVFMYVCTYVSMFDVCVRTLGTSA